jgi:hypothetical protein
MGRVILSLVITLSLQPEGYSKKKFQFLVFAWVINYSGWRVVLGPLR